MPFWIGSKVAVSVSHNLTISQKRYSAGISFPCPYDTLVIQRFAGLVEFSNIIPNRRLTGDFVKTVTSISWGFEVFCVKKKGVNVGKKIGIKMYFDGYQPETGTLSLATFALLAGSSGTFAAVRAREGR